MCERAAIKLFQDIISEYQIRGVNVKCKELMYEFNLVANTHVKKWFHMQYKVPMHHIKFFKKWSQYFLHNRSNGFISINKRLPATQNTQTSIFNICSVLETKEPKKYSPAEPQVIQNGQFMRLAPIIENVNEWFKWIFNFNETAEMENAVEQKITEGTKIEAKPKYTLLESLVMIIECLHFVFDFLKHRKRNAVYGTDLLNNIKSKYFYLYEFLMTSNLAIATKHQLRHELEYSSEVYQRILNFFLDFDEFFQTFPNSGGLLCIRKMCNKEMSDTETYLNDALDDCVIALLAERLENVESVKEVDIEKELAEKHEYLMSNELIKNGLNDIVGHNRDLFISFTNNLHESCFSLKRSLKSMKRVDALIIKAMYGSNICSVRGVVTNIFREVAFVKCRFLNIDDDSEICYSMSATVENTTIFSKYVNDFRDHLKKNAKVKFSAIFKRENMKTPKNLWYISDVASIEFDTKRFWFNGKTLNTRLINDCCDCKKSVRNLAIQFRALISECKYDDVNEFLRMITDDEIANF